jgi:hypothetical protein
VRPYDAIGDCAANGTAASFAANKLFFIDDFPNLKNNGFDRAGKNYKGPQDSNENVTQVNTTNIYKDFVAAWAVAPYILKYQLCSLERLYINKNLSSSDKYDWGFWENPAQRPKKHMRSFVSLYADDWEKKGLPYFQDYESNVVLDGILNNPIKAPFTANPNNQTYTLISRLAHEVGHVVWFANFVSGWTCDTNTSADFFSDSWQDITFGTVYFHILKSSSYISGTQISGSGYGYTAIDSIDKAAITYDTKYWASILAEVAPDEDFAETFRILVLAKSGLSNLYIGDKHFDVAAEMSDANLKSPYSHLAWKAACIWNHLPH